MNAWAGIATLTVAIVGALSMAPAAAQNARDYGKRPIRMLVDRKSTRLNSSHT